MNKTSLKAYCFSNRSIPLDDFPAPVTEFVLLHGTFGFLSATQNIAKCHWWIMISVFQTAGTQQNIADWTSEGKHDTSSSTRHCLVVWNIDNIICRYSYQYLKDEQEFVLLRLTGHISFILWIMLFTLSKAMVQVTYALYSNEWKRPEAKTRPQKQRPGHRSNIQ